MVTLCEFVKVELVKLRDEFPEVELYIGMALGFDTACAVVACHLEIPFHACLPCSNQSERWAQEDQNIYLALVRGCARTTHYVSAKKYDEKCMQNRNKYMVDRSDLGIALFNGKRGGTRHCLDYAQGVGVPFRNLWQNYTKYLKENKKSPSLVDVEDSKTASELPGLQIELPKAGESYGA